MESSRAAFSIEELAIQIKRWLTPPVFPNEEDKTRRARMLSLALINILVLIPVLIASNFLGGNVPASVILVNASVFILCLVLYYWLRCGRVGLASVSLMALGFAGITAAVANLGTVRAPSTAIYLLMVITAGLLFELRGMIAAAIISSLLVGGLMAAQNMGLLPVPNYSITITQWITYTAIFGWGGSLTFSAIQSMNSALARANSELKERKEVEAELTKHKDHLEELVKGSTAELEAKNAELAEDIAERKHAQEELTKSESKYRQLVEDSLFGIGIARGNQIIFANSALLRIFGYDNLEEFAKIPLTDHVAPESQMLIAERMKEIDEGKSLPPVFEYAILRKDGRTRVLRASSTQITIGGEIFRQTTFQDITEQKQAEEALRASEDRLMLAFDAANEGMWEWNIETGEAYFSPQYYAMLGYEPNEFHSDYNAWLKLLHPDDLARTTDYIQERIRCKFNDYEVEFRLRTRDRGWRWILSKGKAVAWNPNGEIQRMVGTHIDITDRKHAEEALLESEQRLANIIDFLPDATLVIDNEKKVIAWNYAIENMTGVRKSEMIGQGDHAYTVPFYGVRRKQLLDLIDLDDKELASRYKYVKRKGNVLYAETHTPALYGGKGAYVWATGAPLFDNKGNRIGAIESIRDITDFKKAEMTLQEQYNFLQQLIDSIPNPVFYRDTKGVYIGCNNAFEAITGLPKDKIIGHTVYELYPRDLADIYHDADGRLLGNPGVQNYESSMANADGSRRDVMFSRATYFDTEGRLAGLVGVILDITERKQMETALVESERRLADIINFLPDATLVIDKYGKVIAWNRALEVMTGINAQDILGKGDYEYSLPFYNERRPMLVNLVLESHPDIEKGYSDLSRTDGTLVGYTFVPKLNGVGAYVWGVASPIYDSHGEIVGAIESLRDITEQKSMENDLQESKDYLDKIINSLGDPLFVKDRQHRITLVNDASCRLWGRPKDEIIGKTSNDLFQSKETANVSWKNDEEVFVKGIEVMSEETNTYADRILTVLVKKTPYTDNAGNQYLVGITRDITERKAAEDRIKASLQEKDVLLKEVHHRVKNNLQIISALLSLQSSCLTDEDLIRIFRDSQNRIRSMALVHENLYRSKDLNKVDFNEYINQLVTQLSQSYGDLFGKIRFKINSENVYLNINTAIPCGMIINELVSNSFKHAFPDGRSGEVRIDLSSVDDGFMLVVSDNGVGIRGGPDIRTSKTLGFRLIETLVRQIHGKIKLDTANGFRCEIHLRGIR